MRGQPVPLCTNPLTRRVPSCGMLISAIHEEEGEERLNLIQLDASIPAGAKMY